MFVCPVVAAVSMEASLKTDFFNIVNSTVIRAGGGQHVVTSFFIVKFIVTVFITMRKSTSGKTNVELRI
jgi:hypothetical protein